MNLLDAWPAILFGWPAIVVALALSVTGIVRRKPLLLLFAIILVGPISLYVTGSPRYWWLGLSVPLLLAGASIAIRFRQNTVAWSLVGPVFGIFSWLALAAITQ